MYVENEWVLNKVIFFQCSDFVYSASSLTQANGRRDPYVTTKNWFKYLKMCIKD